MIKDITVPEIGENVVSGEVVGVLVSVGDIIEADQGVVELETDKAVVEIPCPERGRIAEIAVGKGDTVKVGQLLAKLETDVGAEKPASAHKPAQKAEAPASASRPAPREEKPVEKVVASGTIKRPAAQVTTQGVAPAVVARQSAAGVPASPSVRRIARELGADLAVVPGSGPGGRITEEDVKAFVRGVTPEVQPAEISGNGHGEYEPSERSPEPPTSGEVEHVLITKVRRITAERMSHAWNTVPHVTQFDRADITNFEKFRDAYAHEIEEAGGKLTITAVVLKVIAAALIRFPKFNASIDLESNEIIFKKYVNIGIAVDTERGLLVPVIRDVDKKGIRQLALDLSDISSRARSKKLTPDEMEGGTFTISNQGGIGGTNFTPIVYWPQVAILGMSRSSIEPVFINGQFQARTILPLSLSYDHRIIDGAEAARFLRWVGETIEQPYVLALD